MTPEHEIKLLVLLILKGLLMTDIISTESSLEEQVAFLLDQNALQENLIEKQKSMIELLKEHNSFQKNLIEKHEELNEVNNRIIDNNDKIIDNFKSILGVERNEEEEIIEDNILSTL